MNENILNGNEGLDDENTNKESELKNSEATDTEKETEEETSGSRFQEFFSESVESNKPKLTDILLTFIELKNVDEELYEIEEEKGDLPDNIASIKEKLENTGNRLTDRKSELERMEKEKDVLLSTDSSFEEKINKYDEQKFDVRSNKEYDEIVKTIDGLFEEVKKNEQRIVEIDKVSAILSGEIETLEHKYSELNSELEEKQKLLNELDDQFKQEESVLRDKRSGLMTKLDEHNISLYERVNKMYKGEATAIVRKGNCSGCYNSIPPQRVIEIKFAEKIYTCQSCGRILISDEIAAS